MRALDELIQCKGVFGPDAARRVTKLLQRLLSARVKASADLIALHETVLYLRAYPQSARVARLADQLLASFSTRLRKVHHEAFEDPELSGIAGTAISSSFSYEFARSLVLRHRAEVQIDWENYERPDRLGPVLADLLPAAAEAWTVEPHVDWQHWFEASGCTLRWLLERVQPKIYDLLEIPIRWDLGDSLSSRSRLRLPRGPMFYHTELLRRRDVSIEAEFAAPRIPVTRLPEPESARIAGIIIDVSAPRYRELWGFSHPDLQHFYHADFGRGIEFYFSGIPKQWRLPLRAYHSGMFFKNGVPIGYYEGLSLAERMEAGFNLYYTFREGETAWLYARTLKLFRERLGIECFSIDPYQVGHDNEEAIDSGAFWFYRKLGFRSALPDAARIALGEERRLAKNPQYRTPAATLRRLAESPMLYVGDVDGDDDAWGTFSIQRLAQHIDRRRQPAWQVLGAPSATRAKNAPEEARFLRLLQSSPKLRAAILRSGQPE